MGSYADELTSILLREFGNSPLFVVKDPRICRLVRLWRQVLRRSGAKFAPVLTIRNPLEVAASLNSR